MVRKEKLWGFTALLCLLCMSIPDYSGALPYNLDTIGLTIRAEPITDIHSFIFPQICDFKITKIQDVQADVSNSYSDDSFNDGDKPAEWGCMEARNEQNDLSYYSSIYKKSDENKLLWTYIAFSGSNHEYNPNSKDSDACIILSHESLSGELGSDNVATVDRDVEPSTIGVVSFDVMTHLNISSGNSGLPYYPFGTFNFELDDSIDGSPTLQLVWKTVHISGNLYAVGVFVKKIDPITGLKTNEEQIFQGTLNNFNWMNVKVFFDLYNDVYNITIGQYNLDFSNWLVTPTSTVVRGHQYNPSKFLLTNVGHRYAPSHLINSLDFWVETYADADVSGYPSRAYIDNVNVRTWKFPAVYADVRLQNASINQVSSSGISYMNNSIISCYGPPNYPGYSYSIEYAFNYLRNVKNKGYITPWIMAPQWIYSIPLFVTNDHNLNARSILHVLNDLENPIEMTGVIDPSIDSPYFQTKGSGMNAQYFEMDMENSTAYYYIFRARYSNKLFLVEYYNDLGRAGIIKKIGLYEESVYNTPIILFAAKSSGGSQLEDAIPGYPLEIITIGVGVILVVLYSLKKKNTH